MAGFDNQMYRAAYEARPAVFNQANGKFYGDEVNPFLGIVVWHLITRGTTIKNAQKQLDDARKRVRIATELKLERAVDVAGWMDLINETVGAYYHAGGTEQDVAADVLPDLLKTLSTGKLAYGRPDVKEWVAIGAVADDFKKTWDDTGNLT